MTRAHRIRDLPIILLLIVFLAGCAVLQKTKPWSEWAPKEKAAWMDATYNRQYDDYVKVASLPSLTEEQKDVLRAKKRVLTKIWPMLKLYSQYAENSQVPAIELEAEIMRLINQLLYGGP